ncbi:4-hydroxy-tetrahydrodipicolinate synthase [Algoriphagus namhaensis]
MTKFKGTGVALVTPFHEDHSLDFEGLKKLIDHTVTGGVDYLVVMGTTGESPVLSAEEKKQILAKCVDYNQQRVPIMVGVGGNSTQAVLDQLDQTDFNGVDGILSVSPYYNKPTQAGIVAHYTQIADAAPVPVMLYNIPGRTMSNIEAKTTLQLASHPNIIGVKEASGNWEQCLTIAAHKPDDFLLVSGDDLMTIALNAIGGSGIISVLANAYPGRFKKLCHGTSKEQQQAAFDLIQLNSLMYLEGNPVGVKNLLKHLGICGDQVRLPMLQASEELDRKIKAALLL